ncbi:type II toxin-antitoxin system Y4mF family antitoxin [Phytoactinopolyspora mesophila]|uniref:Type II toxin-antitoxin system Y4mF family antitoxin n=1 Tax=Phytoactinopolyspora mesophila TaxID=2650750 RepID=A0A7K3MBD7_9ACTN|nr:type II toxin-antitoxin system Y4mF family antitoxin [Phytoactinopolyspora mesophila]NDL60337.1 type II toxin-antitoxin system Y4mF family antitoxin [Phytoactinopolyspora mesophila]
MADREDAPHLHDRADVAVLGRQVRWRRKQLDLRQEELADLAGCSERFVHMLEAGKPTVRLDKVLDVLRVLGLHLEVRRGVADGITVADT